MIPLFYFPVVCRVYPSTSHLDVDPERFSRCQLIQKASLKVWPLILLVFDFFSCKRKNATTNLSLQPLGNFWMKGPLNV